MTADRRQDEAWKYGTDDVVGPPEWVRDTMFKRPPSEREIAANYKGRIDRAIEVLDDAYGHADAPYEPAALNALHILRGLS